MNKSTANFLLKVTTSAMVFVFVFAVSESKVSAADKLPQRDRDGVVEMTKQLAIPSVAVVARTAAFAVENGELRFSEMLTINGLALAASGLVGVRRFRQGKKVKGV
jgi:hypothetical protein